MQTTTTNVQSVSIVLSILACPGGSCPNAGTDIGTVLFAGPFNPTGTTTPEQSFNVTIPTTFAAGTAEFLATHFGLSGPAVCSLQYSLRVVGQRADPHNADGTGGVCANQRRDRRRALRSLACRRNGHCSGYSWWMINDTSVLTATYVAVARAENDICISLSCFS
jgi:hypothetical protein